MTYQQEFKSWMFPKVLEVSPIPRTGGTAPSTERLPIPRQDRKPTVVTFLRHCGCPFAEKTFRRFRDAASKQSSFAFVAVSHSDQESTQHWLKEVGGAGNIEIIVDPERALYARWGLGQTSAWGILNSLWTTVQLGRSEGIWNRPTESGNRWQSAGSFAVDSKGVVVWESIAEAAADIPDFGDALSALQKA